GPRVPAPRRPMRTLAHAYRRPTRTGWRPRPYGISFVMGAEGLELLGRYGEGAPMRLAQDPRRWGMPQPGEPQQPGPPPELITPVAPWLEERLFDRRLIMMHGALDSALATRTVAALMALEAAGAGEITLHMSTPEGDLNAAFAIVDALDMVTAPVHVVVTSRVGGAAIAVLAAADKRLAYRHATLRLCEPPGGRVVGTADEVAAAAGQYLRALEELIERIASVTGRPRSRVEDDLSTGRTLTAEEGLEYGLIDEIIGKPSQS